MECRTVQNSLSDYLDGALVTNQAQLIEGHLHECVACNGVKLDLTEIRVAARELPLHAPPRALWARIQQQIEAEDQSALKGRDAAVEEGGLSRWWREFKERQFTFKLPQLAGAGALAMILVGVSVFSAYRQGTGVNTGGVQNVAASVIPEEPALIKRIDTLVTDLNSRKASWDPAIQKIFDTNLTRIKQSLGECRQKLVDNPNDKEHQQRVRDLYKQEIELLEEFDKIK